MVTYLPAHTTAADLPAPARFQFVLANSDWHLLIKLAGEKGGPIADFWTYLAAVTSDTDGKEIPWDTPETIMECPYYLCTIAVSDFLETGIRPGDFNDYIGETELIPIVYDMVHHES